MRIEGAFLRSKVARRIIWFFILSALIPVAATTLLSLHQVQNLLTEQGHARLAQRSEAFAASLYDRLLAAEQRVHDLSARVAADAVLDDAERGALQRQFIAIGIVDRLGQVRPLVGKLNAAPAPDFSLASRRTEGGSILASVPASPTSAASPSDSTTNNA